MHHLACIFHSSFAVPCYREPHSKFLLFVISQIFLCLFIISSVILFVVYFLPSYCFTVGFFHSVFVLEIYFTFIFVYVCLCVDMCEGICRGQKRTSYPLQLNVQALLSHLTLGTNPGLWQQPYSVV